MTNGIENVAGIHFKQDSMYKVLLSLFSFFSSLSSFVLFYVLLCIVEEYTAFRLNCKVFDFILFTSYCARCVSFGPFYLNRARSSYKNKTQNNGATTTTKKNIPHLMPVDILCTVSKICVFI